MFGYNLEKYYSKLQKVTKESDEVTNNFFKTLSLNLDRNIEKVDKSDPLKFVSYFHQNRFLALMNIVEGTDE